jgi:hypothetical protein
MTWCLDAPPFVVAPTEWGAAYASRYDPDNGRPVITPCTKLIVHHSASNQPPPGQEAAFSQQIEAYGESRDGAAIEYHYLVYPSGVLHGGFGDTRGCHCNATDPMTGSAYNSSAIGICFVGYFHPPYNHQPTPEAIATFQEWLTWMINSGRLYPDVLTKAGSAGQPGWYGHRDVAGTACPGDVLYPMLPEIIQVTGNGPAPSPGGEDMYVIYRSIDADGNRWAWADFMGLRDGNDITMAVEWLTGDEMAEFETANAAGYQEFNRGPGGYKTFRLEGRGVDEINAADQQYRWSPSDFRAVP